MKKQKYYGKRQSLVRWNSFDLRNTFTFHLPITWLFLPLVLHAANPSWLISRKGNTFTVNSKKIEEEFKNGSMKALSSLGFKIIPQEKGELYFSVITVKKEGLAENLGVQGGDLLKTLNGKAATVDLMLSKKYLPKEWDNKTKYVLLLERKGKDETLTYLVK